MPSKKRFPRKNSASRKRLRVLVTAGPTREFFDPVRFLSNPSSGRMGYALAEAAVRAGHRVTLVSGPVNLTAPKRCRFVSVVSALDMRRAALREARRADMVLMCAAVSDWRPQRRLTHKLKKSGRALTVRFVPNPDILMELGRRKRPGQILVGFAAETRNMIRHAHGKLQRKNLDAIVANSVGRSGAGFESDENKAILLFSSGKKLVLRRMPKRALAARIFAAVTTDR